VAPKIKLQRVGAKNQPKYRVVVQEAREKLNGKVTEILGIYHPLEEPSLFQVDKEKALDWIKKGALPTDKVRILLGKSGILPPVDLSKRVKRKKKGEEEKKEEPKAEAKAEGAGEGGAKAEEKPKEKPKEEPKKEEPPKQEEKPKVEEEKTKPSEAPAKEEAPKEEEKK